MLPIMVVVLFAALEEFLFLYHILWAFFAGLFGGVSFKWIFLRSIAGSIVFAALGFALSLILRKFLPEIFTAPHDANLIDRPMDENGETPGSQVDIVIEDTDTTPDEEESEEIREVDDENMVESDCIRCVQCGHEFDTRLEMMET